MLAFFLQYFVSLLRDRVYCGAGMLLKSVAKCLNFYSSKFDDEIGRSPLDWGKIYTSKVLTNS